jgi:hypothetical protein
MRDDAGELIPEGDSLLHEMPPLPPLASDRHSPAPTPPAPEDYVEVVFDGPPGPQGGRFVEVESPRGTSINFGAWINRGDGYWALRFRSWARPTLTDPVGRLEKALLLRKVLAPYGSLGSPEPWPDAGEIVDAAVSAIDRLTREVEALKEHLGGAQASAASSSEAAAALSSVAELLCPGRTVTPAAIRDSVAELRAERDEVAGAIRALADLLSLKAPLPTPDEVCACVVEALDDLRFQVRLGADGSVTCAAPTIDAVTEMAARLRAAMSLGDATP